MSEFKNEQVKLAINRYLKNYPELVTGLIILNRDKELIYYDSVAKELLCWLNDEFLGQSFLKFPLKEVRLKHELSNGVILKCQIEKSQRFYLFKKIEFEDEVIEGGYIYAFNEYKEQVFLQKKLEYLSTRDGLTDIYNQITILNCAEKNFLQAKKNKNIFSVTVLDIDKFKRINDSFGHVFGNKILFKIAKTINKMFKNTPYSYGRFGGDEFLIVSSNCNIGEYKVKLNNLLEKISNIKVDDLNHIKLSMSSGTHYVDFANNNISDSFEDAIAFADKKMYLAKANKK